MSGHQTSISLEPEFISALQEIAHIRHTSVAKIINEIDASREMNTNLSSAIRVWVLKYFHN